MKRVILALVLFANLINAISPEFYEKNIQILKKLDIEPYFLTSFSFLEKLDYKQSEYLRFIRTIKQQHDFIPAIRQIITEEEIPKEIFYLAIVESGLNTDIISHANAVGVWQFMQETAKMHGLRIDSYIDERKDYFKSTYAAIKYLKRLKNDFGKWYLAILAYNCGENKLKKAIQRAKSDELHILISDKKKYLPLETRNFIKRILAISFLAHDKDFLYTQSSFLTNYTLSKEFLKVEVPNNASLMNLAELANVDYEYMIDHNPHFVDKLTHPKIKNHIYLPYEKIKIFKNNIAKTKNIGELSYAN